MKKIISISIVLFSLITNVFSQSPNEFKYQAVIRSNSGEPIQSQEISLKLSIVKDAADGSIIYSEEHAAKTNAFGLVNLNVGTGITTDDFSTIDWSKGDYFVKIEIDTDGGTNYAMAGASQLLSVPYALYANKAKYAESAPGIWTDKGEYINLENKKVLIGNLAEVSGESIDKLPAFSVDGALYPLIPEGVITAADLDNHTPSAVVGEGIGKAGIFMNYGGDLYNRSFWGVIIDRNGGFGHPDGSYMNGANEDRGSLAIRYRVTDTEFRTDMVVRANGNVGIGTTNPKTKLEVTDGDIYINNVNKGIIMKSPNEQCWRVTIDNNGDFQKVSITCP